MALLAPPWPVQIRYDSAMHPKELDLWHRVLSHLNERLEELQLQFQLIEAGAHQHQDSALNLGNLKDWGFLYDLPEGSGISLAWVGVLTGVATDSAVSSVLGLLSPLPRLHKQLTRRWQDTIGRVVVPATMALQGNLRSLVVGQKTINRELACAAAGDKEAFLRAVKLDRAALNSKVARRLIARARLVNDSEFFTALGHCLTYAPVPDSKRDLGHLTAGLFLLSKAKALPRLTKADAYELFVVRLKWYRDGPNAPESLWRKIKRDSRRLGQ